MKRLLPFSLMSLMAMPAFSAETLIVKLKESSTKAVSSLSRLGTVEELHVGKSHFAFIKTDNKNAFASLTQDPNVEYVEKNLTYTISPVAHNKSSVVNREQLADDLFLKQWGLNNDGNNSSSRWSRGKEGIDINALKAWTLTTGEKEVIVAVIDTGIDYNNPDLKENMLVNEAELNGTAGVDDDGNGYVDDIYGMDFANNDGDPMDDHSHGTHCAGVIGAAHDDQGIKGVMGNVKLIGLKFLTAEGSGSLEGAVKSIAYAIKRGAHIMSNSWGGGGYSQTLIDVIKEASDAGILFVAAAGNDNNDNDRKPSYPASYEVPSVISVGAMDGRGKRAYFSSYGKKSVHVFAPGVDVLSTVLNNNFKKYSGTSMATPHVAGVLGLLLSREPNTTFAEAKQRLMDTAIRSDDLDKYTISGRVDAYRFLTDTRN